MIDLVLLIVFLGFANCDFVHCTTSFLYTNREYASELWLVAKRYIGFL